MLKTSEGWKIGWHLMNIMLPSVLSLIKGNMSLDQIMNSKMDGKDGAMIQDIVSKISFAIDADYLLKIAKTFAEYTDVIGEGEAGKFGDAGAPLKVHFDDHFAGRYLDMLRWFWFAMKLNFASFTDGLTENIGDALSALKSLEKREAVSSHPIT